MTKYLRGFCTVHKTAIRAVVVGAEINGLGVVRSLGHAGIYSIVLGRSWLHPAMHSRFATPIKVAALGGEPLLAILQALPKNYAHAKVLIMTCEEAVTTVSQHAARLQSWYHFCVPSLTLVLSLMTKEGFQKSAESLGLPIPKAVHVHPLEQWEERLALLNYPCILKPDRRFAAYDAHCKKGYKIFSAAEAVAMCRQMLPLAPALIVQEWIEGGDETIYFTLQFRPPEGPPLSFTGKKIRSWRPQIGVTASCTVANDKEADLLEKMTNHYFSAMQVVGLVSMEYKKDCRTGQFWLVEPTIGRTDWQEEVATLHGVNIPLAYFNSVSAQTVMINPVLSSPVIWRDTLADWRSRQRQQGGDAGWPDGTKIYDAIFRWHDFFPALVYYPQRILSSFYQRFF